MPLNKNAAFRYRIIDQVFKGQIKMSFNELKETIDVKLREEFGTTGGISDRTLYNDINLMRSEPPRGYNAPIVCENGLYSYSNSNFSIHDQPLRNEDIQSIHEALSLLKQFGRLPIMENLSGLISETGKELLREKEHNGSIIQFDTNPGLKGFEKIGLLYDTIRNCKELLIVYLPFSCVTPESYRCQPYLLKEYNKRWYLIGKVVEAGKIYHLALDRIISVEETGRTYKNPVSEAIKQRFEDVVGITIPEDQSKKNVIFKVFPGSLQYVLTKPLHQSQKLLDKNNEYALFSIQVIFNYELESLLLSFGENLMVIEPDILRKKLEKRISQMQKIYGIMNL